MISVRKSLKILSGSLLILTFAVGIARGAGESNARAVGMSGAYTALARDLEAPYWNPANLGLSDDNRFSINIFSVGAGFRNNSFSLADYNRYSGQFLNDDDKQKIISMIPADGLRLDVSAEASALNFSVGSFAFTSSGYGVSAFNLDRDPFELLLYGNSVKNEVSFSDTRGEGFGIADFSLSYGHPVQAWEGGELAVGASLHYLKGIAFQKIVNSEGGVATADTGFIGDGSVTVRTSMGGSGFAADMGIAVRFEDTWYFSAAWQNFYSKLTWNTEPEEMLYTFNMEPITITGIADSSASDSLVTSRDTTYSVEPFSSRMPSLMKLGLAKKYRNFIWSIDWEQALADRPGHGINPRVAVGLEYRPTSFLPLRTGLATGGKQGSTYSFGFGLYFGPYHFDLGFANTGSPSPWHTKGAKFAIGMGLYF